MSNKIEEIDFDKLCRICCSSKSTMVSIFHVHISKKIMSLASVQIWESDGLPSLICKECIVNLNISCQFKKMCEKSDQTLRQLKIELDERKATKTRKRSRMGRLLELNNVSNSLICQMQNTDLSASTVSRNLEVSVPDMELSNNILTDISHTIPSSLKSTMELMAFSYEEACEESIQVTKSNQEAEERGYKCATCLKVFGTATKLSRHLYVHTGKKPFQCRTCNKAFSHNSNLKAHMKLHSEDKPYVCSICQKGCKRVKDLTVHMRVHTGYKPHVCHTCGRAFSSSSNLIAHERIHTGEKPYVCDICHKAFCQSSEMKKHKKIHKTSKDHTNISNHWETKT